MFAPRVAMPKAAQPQRSRSVWQGSSQSAVNQAHRLPRDQATPAGAAAHAAPPLADFSKVPVQAKLKIAATDDAWEKEADRAADQVMRAPEPRLQRPAACGGERPTCQTKKARQGDAQSKSGGSGELGSAAAPPIVHEILRSPGAPLDAATRAFMEPRFGHDFSRVRVHTDARAAASAEAVRARAYTVGSNVVFGAHEYAPSSARGRELLAHELAHTIQQRPALARKPADDARAKAVAEAEAVATRLGHLLVDDDDDTDTKPAARANKVSSRFLPGGFTDEEADKLYREAEDRTRLGSMAITLAERQARRREFWDRNPSYNSADVKEAFDLDLYWDPKEEGFVRQPYVDKTEAIVFADPEARRLYNTHLWDLTHNKPAAQSRFTRAVHFVCKYTEPCSSNIEAFRRDRESGMSRDEALNRGMARLVATAETMALPGGPSGPVQLGPGGQPGAMPFDMPAPEGAGLGGAERPAAPTSKPLLSTGSKSGPPPKGEAAPSAEPAVPEPIADEPTNPIPREGAKVGEPVGDFRIYGEKTLKGGTFEREIWGLRSNEKPTMARGVRPVLELFKSLIAEARASGATKLRIVGRAVRNENIFEMEGIVKKYGGTFRRVDAMTVEIEIPLSRSR